jgi:hypothetical protein
MNVRELIQELVNEDDLNSSVYVAFEMNGEDTFLKVGSIRLLRDSFKVSEKVVCTTISAELI